MSTAEDVDALQGMESQTAQTISDVASAQEEATTLEASIAVAQQRLKQLDDDVQQEQHSRVRFKNGFKAAPSVHLDEAQSCFQGGSIEGLFLVQGSCCPLNGYIMFAVTSHSEPWSEIH